MMNRLVDLLGDLQRAANCGTDSDEAVDGLDRCPKYGNLWVSGQALAGIYPASSRHSVHVWAAIRADMEAKKLPFNPADLTVTIERIRTGKITDAKADGSPPSVDQMRKNDEESDEKTKKTAESASGSTAVNNAVTKKPVESTSKSDTKPLDAETEHILELAPRMTEVITDMWNASALRQGRPLVVAAIEKKYSVHLGALSREVYQAFKTSNGIEEGLQVLIKRYSQRPTAPPGAPPSAMQPAIITPTDLNSSTNPAPQPNIAPNIAPNTVPNTTSGDAGSAPGSAPDPVLAVFERNWKLSDEEVQPVSDVKTASQQPPTMFGLPPELIQKPVGEVVADLNFEHDC